MEIYCGEVTSGEAPGEDPLRKTAYTETWLVAKSQRNKKGTRRQESRTQYGGQELVVCEEGKKPALVPWLLVWGWSPSQLCR